MMPILQGPLPAALQNYTEIAGGVLATSQNAEAAKLLIGFLTAASAKTVMKTKGFE